MEDLAAGMTKDRSKFKRFSLDLGNGGTLSGIAYVPPTGSTTTAHRPLLVLLHGGGCHDGYYDVDEAHTASIAAEALSVPVVSIDRPSYRSTSSLFPIPEDSSFHRETGRLEHCYIIPTLWQAYGLTNGCNALVVMSHSMGTPGLLVAASLHSQTVDPVYPLAGLIISGWGSRANEESQKARLSWTAEERRSNRGLLLLSDPALNTADKKVNIHLAMQTADPPSEEAQEVVGGPWSTYFPYFAERINVPIMFRLSQHDWL